MANAVIRGLPFTRSYSLEDIGRAPRGSGLGFDRFGRVAVMHEGIYTVLNDSVWLNIAEPGDRNRNPMVTLVQAPDDRTYYGARGSWGSVEPGADGRLHSVSLVPANPPSWIAPALFKELTVTGDGVYFASWNGVVFRAFKQKKDFLFGVPRIARVFQVGSRIYISAYDTPLQYIDATTATLRSAAGTELDRNPVRNATTLDNERSLVVLEDGRLAVFDGQKISTWLSPEKNIINGNISALRQLVDGRIAIGVQGQGLLLFSTEGELLMALTTSQYHNVTALANREPGVLWVATEDAVAKILYGSPLSSFGQRLGLPVGWPIVTSWNGRIFVASDGRLYRAMPGNHGEPTRFELCDSQPPHGAWALAAWGPHMLVGNGEGLFAAESDGTFQAIPSVGDLASLVMIDENRCYAIGRAEIALLEWRGGHWIESVPRIPGVRNPAVVHRIKDSAWIEMGGDGVARLWTHDGRLQLDVVRNESWTEGSWVNIGAVGDIVVLSSAQGEPRRFFDQKSGSWGEAPQVQELLARSPYWIARMFQDKDGVIWATHNEGLIRFASNGRDYDMDVNSFDLANDRYPIVRLLPDDDVWVSAERSLYHIERTWIAALSPPLTPRLVALTDLQTNEDLRATRPPTTVPLRLSYAKNNLSFRFYSGTDSWRRAPVYEYRLSGDEPWMLVDGSQLSLRGLREGKYRLQVRIAAVQPSAAIPLAFEFEILPPWHRSWPAYLLYGTVAVILLAGVTRWSSYLERRRSRRLEQEVRERTRQLESAMTKLGEETRKSATLAERDRMANEIHDSVQQGLTGAILQLDTTLKSSAMNGAIRSRLNVVRNMISYARQEVQHAVWDMESPLLEGTELAAALRNLTAFVNADGITIDVSVVGTTVPLDRTMNHNLLRIAQEATTNAFRHASARHINVELKYEANSVWLGITDDGIGFCPDDVLHHKHGHLGLRGIKARVKKLRGTVSIESAPGQGTSVRITVPLAIHQTPSSYAETDRG